jgi:hypothetical protein
MRWHTNVYLLVQRLSGKESAEKGILYSSAPDIHTGYSCEETLYIIPRRGRL